MMNTPELILGGGVRGIALGVLVMENAGGTDDADILKRRKQELVASLREQYGSLGRAALKALHPMDVFTAYYRKFGYTYHVLPQLESVLRGKDIPDVLPPVAAMFMAELKNQLLTAGHDADKIAPPLTLLKSTGNELMASLSGKDVTTVPGDFMVSDREGVISAILRGCDSRTAVTPSTRNVLYTVYAPEGIARELVRHHLDDIEAYVRLYAEAPVTVLKEVYGV
jgi:DNA/RNA-binding domain of Phe-tRNA-synthetase-like protein